MLQSAKQSELLVRMPNWLGDTLMALPAIALLRSADWRITLIGRPWMQGLLAAHLEFSVAEWPIGMRSAMTALRNQPGHRLLLMTNSFSSALIARLSGKQTMGYARDGRAWLLTQRVPAQVSLPERQQFINLARSALQRWGNASAPQSVLPAPQLKITPDAAIQAQALLALNQVPKRFIVLCPFAQGLTKQKQSKIWPHWQRLSRQLRAFNPIICPGPNEVTEAKRLFPEIPCIEHVDLACYAAILARAQLALCNDSGPMHLASAVNCPTIALFGATEPARFAPLNVRVLGQYGQWAALGDVQEAMQALFC